MNRIVSRFYESMDKLSRSSAIATLPSLITFTKMSIFCMIHIERLTQTCFRLRTHTHTFVRFVPLCQEIVAKGMRSFLFKGKFYAIYIQALKLLFNVPEWNSIHRMCNNQKIHLVDPLQFRDFEMRKIKLQLEICFLLYIQKTQLYFNLIIPEFPLLVFSNWTACCYHHIYERVMKQLSFIFQMI